MIKVSQDDMLQFTYSCRICFLSKSNEADPLVTPCKCTGSMSYIHYNCLKQCINMKMVRKESDQCITYLCKSYECEICLTEYPKYIKYKSFVYNLLDINTTYDQYALLDYILYEEEKHKFVRKGFIVLKLKDNHETTIVRVLYD